MDKTLLITGGARGIGAATALRAAREGFHVCITYRNDHDAALRVVQQIRAAGRSAVAVCADACDETAVERVFAAASKELPPLAALVNNAGIVGRPGRLDALDSATLRCLVAVNLVAPVLYAKAAVRCLSKRHGGEGGAIVNVSSRASASGGAGEYVAYAATKGAIDSLTLGLAREVAAEGVRVNAVAPGMIATDIQRGLGGQARLDRIAPTIPMLRVGRAEEVAEAIVWLLSPAAAYVTGAILPVSGGR